MITAQSNDAFRLDGLRCARLPNARRRWVPERLRAYR